MYEDHPYVQKNTLIRNFDHCWVKTGKKGVSHFDNCEDFVKEAFKKCHKTSLNFQREYDAAKAYLWDFYKLHSQPI